MLHDSTIDRTSNGTGNIASMTLAEARSYDYGGWHSKEFIGEKIPTFEEFIALCREINLQPYIELKAGITVERARLLVDIVTRYGVIDKVCWISFGFDSVKNIVAVEPTARVSQCVSTFTQTEADNLKTLRTGKNEVFAFVNTSGVNNDAVNLCIAEGFELVTWTLNNPWLLDTLNPYVSGVCSDWMHAGLLLKEKALAD
jgi:glycerophosphoryl diester phosphodiesterase